MDYETFASPDETHCRDEHDYDPENFIEIEAADLSPECPVRSAIVEKSWNAPISEFMELLRAHESLRCEYCSSGRKDVVSDRTFKQNAVCCDEGKVA